MEISNDVATDPLYWDCECEDHYIHRKDHKECKRCGCIEEDMPDSRVAEVRLMYKIYPESYSCLCGLMKDDNV